MRKVRARSALALATVWAAVMMLGMREPDAATPELVIEEFMIDAADSGTRLYVRNKHPKDLQRFAPERTLLFVHGASQPAEATFDLQLDGLSWMDFIARSGWDVYLVDVRGYGRSTRPPEMDRPPEENPPIVRTDVAVGDLGAAVGFILQRRGVPRLSLMGWSWGTTLVAGYTAEHPDKVERLVLYAPLWLSTPSPGEGIPAPSGAYVATPMHVARWRLQAGAPDDEKNSLLPPAWFEAWSAAALASDPVGAAQDPAGAAQPGWRAPGHPRPLGGRQADLRPGPDHRSHAARDRGVGSGDPAGGGASTLQRAGEPDEALRSDRCSHAPSDARDRIGAAVR